MAEAYTQADRRFAVTAPDGESDLLLLQEMTVHETISGDCEMQLSLLSEDANIKLEDMIGGAIAVRVNLTESGIRKTRWFHGIVSRFSQGPPVDGFVSYRAEVVPWLWLLKRGSDCRIFQRLSVPDILRQVFDGFGFKDYRFELKGTHPQREYCVQYRETHFDFARRLMEEAGIAYYVDADERGHEVVFFDDPSANQAVIVSPSASYASAEDSDRGAGEIEELTYERLLQTGKHAVTDYNMKDPGMDLLAEAPTRTVMGGNEKYEVYDFPGGHQSLKDGEGSAKQRMEVDEAASYHIEGVSSRGDFQAGRTFDLEGHYRDGVDTTYLLTGVVHHASQSYGREQGGSYTNRFTCIPHEVPFRPATRTPRPVISGAQTATVVGAKGEEIDVDEFGRVILQFHWDRQGKRDDKSSCRVRVSQNWAGKRWGAVFHPRIGQEVIVEFLEGDPDRPIVTGRVYNGEQQVGFDLPGEKTQSGVKSRSTLEGNPNTFNEIRFEDKKGSELFALQAEKDIERLVKNDERDDVQHDRSRNVGNDESVTIGANQVVQISKDHSETVGESETLDVAKTRTRSVGETETVSVGEDQSLTISNDRTISVGKNQQVDIGEDLTVQIGNDRTETVGGQSSTTVAEEYALKAKSITFQADDQIAFSVGSAKIVMKKNGDITISGGKVQLKGSKDVVVKGSKILQN